MMLFGIPDAGQNMLAIMGMSGLPDSKGGIVTERFNGSGWDSETTVANDMVYCGANQRRHWTLPS
jgi:hypothetical protein